MGSLTDSLGSYQRWFRVRHTHLQLAALCEVEDNSAISSGAEGEVDMQDSQKAKGGFDLLRGTASLLCDAPIGQRMLAATMLRLGAAHPLRVHRVDLFLHSSGLPKIDAAENVSSSPVNRSDSAGSGSHVTRLVDVCFDHITPYSDEVPHVSSATAFDEFRRAAHDLSEDGELLIPLQPLGLMFQQSDASGAKFHQQTAAWMDFLTSEVPLNPQGTIQFTVIVHFSVPASFAGLGSSTIVEDHIPWQNPGIVAVPGAPGSPCRVSQFHTMGEFGGARQWFPCVDTLTDLFTVTADIHVPSSCVAVFSGHLTERRWADVARSRIIHRFEQTCPIRAAHVSLSVGPFEWLPGDLLHISSPLCPDFEPAVAELLQPAEDEDGEDRFEKKRRRVYFQDDSKDRPLRPVEKMRLNGFCPDSSLSDLNIAFLGVLGKLAEFVETQLGAPLPFGSGTARIASEKQQAQSIVAPHSAPSEMAFCFVDDGFDPLSPGKSLLVSGGASLVNLSVHLLAPTNMKNDTGFNSKVTLIDSMAFQYFGCLLMPKTWSDYWLIVGLRLWVVESWIKHELGDVAYEYSRRLTNERLSSCDDRYSPLHSLRPAESGGGGDAYANGAGHPWDAVARNPVFAERSLVVVQMIESVIGPQEFKSFVSRLVASAMVAKTRPNGLPSAAVSEGVRRQTRLDCYVRERVLTTSRFLKALKKSTKHDLSGDFAERWIYGHGCPTFDVAFWLDRKLKKMEVAVKHVELAAFADNDPEMNSFQAWPPPFPPPQSTPATLCVVRTFERSDKPTREAREAEFVPFDSLIELSDPANVLEYIIRTWPRKPRTKVKKSSGKEVLEVMNAMEASARGTDPEVDRRNRHERDMQQKRALQLATPLLWFRLDPDSTFPHTVRRFTMPEFLWVNQLIEDGSPVGQREACEALAQLPVTFVDNPELVITHTGPRDPETCDALNDIFQDPQETKFWQLRVDALFAIGARVGNETDLLEALGLVAKDDILRHPNGVPANLSERHFGAEFLAREYRRRYHDAQGPQPLHFADTIDYYVQCGIIGAIGSCRLQPSNPFLPHVQNQYLCHAFSPRDAVEFLVEVALKVDDRFNSESSALFIATLVRALGRLVIPPGESHQVRMDFATVEKVQVPLRYPVYDQLFRFLALDRIAPSWRNMITVACLTAISAQCSVDDGPADILAYAERARSLGDKNVCLAELLDFGSVLEFIRQYSQRPNFAAVRAVAARCVVHLTLDSLDGSEDEISDVCTTLFRQMLDTVKTEANAYVRFRFLLALRELLPRESTDVTLMVESDPRARSTVAASNWDFWPCGGFEHPSRGYDPALDALLPFGRRGYHDRNTIARRSFHQLAFRNSLQKRSGVSQQICFELWSCMHRLSRVDFRSASAALELFGASYGSGYPACFPPRHAASTSTALDRKIFFLEHSQTGNQQMRDGATADLTMILGIERAPPPPPPTRGAIGRPQGRKRGPGGPRKRRHDSDDDDEFDEEGTPSSDHYSDATPGSVSTPGKSGVRLKISVSSSNLLAPRPTGALSSAQASSSASALALAAPVASPEMTEAALRLAHPLPLGHNVLRMAASVIDVAGDPDYVDESGEKVGSVKVFIQLRELKRVRINTKDVQGWPQIMTNTLVAPGNSPVRFSPASHPS